jgi:hypothetical protein
VEEEGEVFFGIKNWEFEPVSLFLSAVSAVNRFLLCRRVGVRGEQSPPAYRPIRPNTQTRRDRKRHLDYPSDADRFS